jgi:hypothetical protein
VWAEQAYVFPNWHSYSNQLADRAELAGRHWLDSIAPHSRRGDADSKLVHRTSSGKKWSGADAAASVAQRVQELSGATGAAAAAAEL